MSDEHPNASRRRVVGGMAATLVASAASPALAQSSAASAQTSAGTTPATAEQNPATEYPKPPFAKQQQPWPGLASRMDPRPDHGEKVTADRVGCGAARH